ALADRQRVKRRQDHQLIMPLNIQCLARVVFQAIAITAHAFRKLFGDGASLQQRDAAQGCQRILSHVVSPCVSIDVFFLWAGPGPPECYCLSIVLRKRPVWLAFTLATSSGVPSAMISPPPSPPSGPRSMSQSAVLITSRLCSITTMVLPCSRSRNSTPSSCWMSWKCSPVVGSSRIYSVRPVS